MAAGIGVAIGGHVPASGIWLYTTYTFVVYATPDSLFMVACLVGFLQTMLFIYCVVAGFSLYRSRHREFGYGLLVGWGVGIIGLVAGTVVIGLLAEPVQ